MSGETCQFCKDFFHLPIVDHIVDYKGRPIHSKRKCPERKRLVTYETEACPNFKLTNYFLCNKTDNFIHIRACPKRIKWWPEICKISCSQRHQVLNILRGKRESKLIG